jgi:hypothetical protein
MERYLETLGLAIAHSDFNVIPVNVSSSDEDTVNRGGAPGERSSFIAEVRATVRRLALELAHAWTWAARHHGAA